jgi:tetratricopeptide (TPR) repeat protein
MDALKKADEAKKKPLVAPSGLKVNQNSVAVTEVQDSPSPNEEAKDLLIPDKEEELFLFEITDDDNLSATTLTEPTLVTEEDKNDFSLITATNEPFLTETQQYPIESNEKDSWDNEFLPEFQHELEQLENSSIEEVATIEEPVAQLKEFTAYDEPELIQPQLAETQEEITAAEEDTQEQQLDEFNQPNPEIPQEQSALTSAILPVSSRHQARNWFLSLPTANKSKLDTMTTAIDEAEVSTLAEPEIEQELVRIEQVTQTEPDEQTAPRAKPDAQVAQRILAAHTPASSANQRTWWLGGFLVVLLVGMGGGYYYYTQSSLGQPSGLKFGQLNQRLRTSSLSTPPVAETETSPNSPQPALPLPPPNQTESQPTIAQTQLHISKEPLQEPHKATNQTTIPEKERQLSEMPAQAPVKPANALKSNDSSVPTTISADDLLANKKIRTELAKLIADEISKQFAAKMTMIAAKQKADQATANAAPITPKSASAAKTHLPQNKSKTSSPVPPQSNTTEEPSRLPTVQKNLTEKITNELSSAYKNFHQGNEKLAYESYRQILQQDSNNRDALLGFAALAVRHGNLALARQYYQQVLQSNPQDPHAQVGLINTLNYQPASSETQLKLLLANSPHSAYIHFSLGNLYANQGRWAQAQQAYFDAYRYDSSQADYAYNLAISLDQLNQTGAALNYYQQALRLAPNQRVNFNQTAVHKRIQTLMAHTRPSALDNLSVKFDEAREK